MLGIRRQQGKVRERSRRRSRGDCDWYRCRAIGTGIDRGSGVDCRLLCAHKSEIHQPSAGQPAHMFSCAEPGALVI